jgi:hypothetical protein
LGIAAIGTKSKGYSKTAALGVGIAVSATRDKIGEILRVLLRPKGPYKVQPEPAEPYAVAVVPNTPYQAETAPDTPYVVELAPTQPYQVKLAHPEDE